MTGIETGYEQKFDKFWSYFVKTWTKYYEISTWNLFHLIGDPGAQEELLQRTNNCLERYNREMNKEFPVAHPNISGLVTVIKKKSIEYINRITRIQQGDDVATNHNTHVVLPSIPLAYTSFNA